MHSISWIAAMVAAHLSPWQAPAPSTAAPSSAIPAGPQKMATVENMTEYRWPNGFRAILYPDPGASKVTVNMTILVGSRHEGYGETGMAHLLEHMLFKGTPKHGDIPKELRDRGADFNGTTWVDRTNYYETLSATGDNLEFAISLEADRLVNSFVRREDLLKEFSVVRNEFERGENSPENVLSQRMRSAAFEWHNYGKSTIGNRSDIERVPIDNLQAFYRKYYRPDNTILILSGSFKEADALKALTGAFGGLKNPAEPLPVTYTEEPAQDGEREVVLRRVGKVAFAGLLYHIPAAAHPDYPALEVLASALSMQPSGPLYTGLVQGKVASSVFASASGWHDPGIFEIEGSALSGISAAKVRGEMIRVVDEQIAKGIDAANIVRAKQQWIRSRELLMSDSNQIGISLSDWASKGDWRLFFLHRDRVAKVTKEDVDRVLRKYLVRSNRTSGLFDPIDQPERAAIPQVASLNEMVKDYKGGAGVKQGEFFEPTLENIFARTQTGELNSKVRYALLPKKSRNSQVFLSINLGYGNPDSLKGKNAAASLMPGLMKRGTQKKSRQEIEDTLTKLKAQVFANGSAGKLSFFVLAPRESLPKVLELVHEIAREPSFPAPDFEILKNQLRDSLERSKSEPQPLAQRAMLRAMFPYPEDDVRRTPLIEKSLENANKLKVEDLKELYASQVGSENVELTAVGDFDSGVVKEFLTKLTANWNAKTPFAKIQGKAFPEVQGQTITINTPDKANAIYFAGFSFAMRDDHPEFGTLEIANFLLGGGTLSSRLGNRVRQKEGLAYGVNSMFMADNEDYLARWMIQASCNPDAIRKADKAIDEELSKMVNEGFAVKEIEEGKKAWEAQELNQRSNDAGILAILNDALEARRGLDYYQGVQKRISDLDAGRVNKGVKEYFDLKKLIKVEAGDFQKKAPKPAAP